MSLLQPRLILLVAVVITLILLFSLVQEMNRRLQVQREIAHLEQDVQERKKKVVEAENLNQYFQTDDFQERLAREKLNYRAPGEKVILLTDDKISDSLLEDNQQPSISVARKWWEAFFVRSNSGLEIVSQ